MIYTNQWNSTDFRVLHGRFGLRVETLVEFFYPFT